MARLAAGKDGFRRRRAFDLGNANRLLDNFR